MSWPARFGSIAQPSGKQYQLWTQGSNAWGAQDNNISLITLTPTLVSAYSNNTFVSASSGLSLYGGEDFSYLISSSKQCGFIGVTRRTDDEQVRRINAILYNNGNFTGSKFRFAGQGNRDASFITTDGRLWYAWGEANGNMSLYLLSTAIGWKAIATLGVDYGWEGQRVAVKSDGTLWAYGYTQNGSIATGSSAANGLLNAFRQVGTDTNWDYVSGYGGGAHMLARKTDGTLWSWGANGNGQLGNLSVVNRSSPIQIGALTTWTKISAGAGHSAAIKNDGTLWTWGQNTSGQLGLGNTTNRSSPVQVGTLTTWANVFCGTRNTFAIKTDGTLWAMGNNTHAAEDTFAGGFLGTGDFSARSSPVQIGSTIDWTNGQVTPGYISTKALDRNGKFYSWGSNQFNGTLQSTHQNLSWNQVPTTNWSASTHVVCGRGLREDGGTLALKRDNTLWYFGLWNPTSGESDISCIRTSPVQVGTGSNWSSNFALTANRSIYLAIDRNDRLWNLATGNNTQVISQTGSWSRVVGASDNNNSPPQPWFLLVTTSGQLWSWGYNANGQLGLNNTVTSNTFRRVGTLSNWKDVTTSDNQSTLAVKTDGTLWAWGVNTYGQLGLGDVVSRSSPVQVGTDTNWSRVACRAATTHAIKTTGTLWAWGYNGSGEFGNSSAVSRSSPVQVGTDTNWKQVESYGATLGLKTDGTLYIWGFNSYANASTPAGTLPWNPRVYRLLGNTSTVNTSSPVQTGFGWNTWTFISVGNQIMSALSTR